MFGIGKLRRERDQLRRDVEALRREMGEERQKHSQAAAEVERLRHQIADVRASAAVRADIIKGISEQMAEYREALTDIAAMETPNCAHIGKRMAARARQALPGGGPAIRLEPANPPVSAEVA